MDLRLLLSSMPGARLTPAPSLAGPCGFSKVGRVLVPLMKGCEVRGYVGTTRYPMAIVQTLLLYYVSKPLFLKSLFPVPHSPPTPPAAKVSSDLPYILTSYPFLVYPHPLPDLTLIFSTSVPRSPLIHIRLVVTQRPHRYH